MSFFINIHSHKSPNEGAVAIVSYDVNQQVPSNVYLSLGMHPWYIHPEKFQDQLHQLYALIALRKPVAIGECGIDRRNALAIDLQKYCFEEQVLQSEKLKLPMILHCVRAWFDCLEIRKKLNAKQPWIFHGYTGNLDTAQKIIAQNCYVSFGKKIITHNKNAEILAKLSPENIFLETDNDDIAISEIYNRAAQLWDMELEALKKAIFYNFNKIFTVV